MKAMQLIMAEILKTMAALSELQEEKAIEAGRKWGE